MHYQGYTNEYLDSSKAKWGPCPSQKKSMYFCEEYTYFPHNVCGVKICTLRL